MGSALGSGRLPLLLGAAALGYSHKQGWLQKLPLVGKAGPITSAAILGWGAEEVLKFKLPKIAHDAVTAGLVISAFNLGLSGGETIVGNEYPGGAVFFEE